MLLVFRVASSSSTSLVHGLAIKCTTRLLHGCGTGRAALQNWVALLQCWRLLLFLLRLLMQRRGAVERGPQVCVCIVLMLACSPLTGHLSLLQCLAWG